MKRTIFALALFALSVGAHAQLEGLVGKPPPNFKMTDTKGKVHTNKSLKGKVVLLDFWATWCGPCKAASPSMQALHKKLGSKGLMVVGANALERGNAKAATIGYQKEHKYTYTFTYGNDKLAQELGIRGIPAFIIIGKDGKVAKALVGYGPGRAEEMERVVKGLLAK